MLEVQKAPFSFDSFKVPKFSYNEGNRENTEVKIGFLPSGTYNPLSGDFTLTLQFISHEIGDESKTIFDLTAIATFKFSDKPSMENIPSFFYKNAIAIMFPYVRSFVSTLTLQANTKLLKLGLMNLSNLEKPLIENTIEIK